MATLGEAFDLVARDEASPVLRRVAESARRAAEATARAEEAMRRFTEGRRS